MANVRTIGECIDLAWIAKFSELESMCESEAEHNLLACLHRAYGVGDVIAQKRFGKYRMDFVTSDGVGWEIDGKQFHDEERDCLRDEWILSNFDLKQIIRIEAASLHYFPEACKELFRVFCKGYSGRPGICVSADRAIEWADSVCEEFAIYGYSVESMECLEYHESYQIDRDVGYVGSPMAFIPFHHEIHTYASSDRRGLNDWRGKVVRRKSQGSFSF